MSLKLFLLKLDYLHWKCGDSEKQYEDSINHLCDKLKTFYTRCDSPLQALQIRAAGCRTRVNIRSLLILLLILLLTTCQDPAIDYMSIKSAYLGLASELLAFTVIIGLPLRVFLWDSLGSIWKAWCSSSDWTDKANNAIALSPLWSQHSAKSLY